MSCDDVENLEVEPLIKRSVITREDHRQTWIKEEEETFKLHDEEETEASEESSSPSVED